MGGFSGRLHSEEIVTGPKGSRFRVRVGRTGVARFSPAWGGVNALHIVVTGIRYLRGHRKTWTVTASGNGMAREVFLCEEFPNRGEAARRADEVAEAIVAGELPARP